MSSSTANIVRVGTPVAPEAYLVYGVSRVLPQAMRSSARASVV